MTPPTRTTSQRSPVDVEGLRERVDDVLARFLAEHGELLAGVDPACQELVDSAATLIRGGKRLRPAFCYWGWRGAGGPEHDPGGSDGALGDGIVTAATALELFQAAALIHDDLMDGSDTRRGMPAVHRRFAGLHRESDWHGDAEGFGLSGAVLVGDMCLVWTDELFSRCGLPAERVAAGRLVFNRMRTELLGGQYLDVLAQAVPEPDPVRLTARARHVIRYKSAKYSIEHPLLIGATLAGAPQHLQDTYSAYGLALGEAFQLRDDVLGVFGDPAETGKPAGDDLREGKRTVLIGLALQRANAAQAAAVRRLLGDPGLDPEGVQTLRGIVVDTGALDGVERDIERLAAQAHQALEDGPVDAPARDVLDRLVVAATARAH